MNFNHNKLFCVREYCRIRKVSLRLSLMVLLLLGYFGTSVGSIQTLYDSPKIVVNPSAVEEYAPEKREFTGIPSMAVSGKGRRWAVWYAGITPEEDANNYVVVATNNGIDENWEEVLVIDPDGLGPVRAFDPEIWMDPNGGLWIFWVQATPTDGTESLMLEGTLAGVWTLKIENPEESQLQLNELMPSRITDGVMMCKPMVLTTGEWVLPVSMWKYEEKHARMVVSTDSGSNWTIRGAATVPDDVRTFDEHMIVERNDDSLWMLIRTTYGIGESISHDRGYTWSPVVPSKIQHPSSRFFIYRLHSGNLLLVKHGPISMRTKRSHLMAFISEDDGEIWSNGLLLDERPGVSYPDGQQDNHGCIHITYDYNRTKEQQVITTSFTEEDIRKCSDSTILKVFNRREIISQGGKK